MASNPYKNKVVYNGQVLIDLTADTITKQDLRKDKTAHDKSGNIIIGTMLGRPDWVCQGEESEWSTCYFNPNFDFDSILPTLNYDSAWDQSSIIIGGSVYNETAWPNGLFFAVRNSAKTAYAILYVSSSGVTPVYATAAGVFTVDTGTNFYIKRCIAGWNHISVELPTGTKYCTFILSSYDETKIAAGTEIAFGDFIAKPSGSLTITANGTYDISQYASVVVAVPQSSSNENQNVISDTLIFDGNTSISGDTLILDSDATVENDTLIFSSGANNSNPAVVGTDLTLDGDETVSEDTIILDGTLSGDTLILN